MQIVGIAVTLSPIVPWQEWLLWSHPTPAQRISIEVEGYEFRLPPGGIEVKAGEFVEFVATSRDVTYSFGVFRPDGTMVFQMQVIPGYENKIVANLGLNLILHNTKWVIGTHAHTMLLTGLGMLLFAVIYALIPMLTKLEIRSLRLVNVHFWAWLAGSVLMTYVMGMAGSQGMLRRMLYPQPNPYQPYMAVALAGAFLMALGFLAFLVNIIATLGWANVLGLVVPERWLTPRTGQASERAHL